MPRKLRLFSFENIYRAYLVCRKDKRNTINALDFEVNLLQNLWTLHDELNTHSYKISRSLCFLTHSPKLREIFAADFRDRVVHHILVKALEDFYEKKFIDTVYNNRQGKGIHKAVKKAQSYMNRTASGYFLQLDIKGFFYNLDKNILFKKLFRDIGNSSLLEKKELLYLANKIIYHNPISNYLFKGDKSKLALLPAHKTLFKLPKHKGLAIGNLTSQFFANVYLSDFDNYIKRVLKVKSYIRYVDDFVLFDRSRDKLENLLEKIETYLLSRLGLLLREDIKLKNHSSGLDFLGYIIRENYVLSRKRVVNNYKYKKAKYLEAYDAQCGKMKLPDIQRFLAVQASFIGHVKQSNSYNLIKKVGVINESNPFDFDRV